MKQDVRLRSSRATGRPTMQDIADRVGIRAKSVSRELNGEPGTSPRRRERVLDVSGELGFRRNDLARSLARGDRTGTVGLVLRHSSTRFYENLIRGVDEVADAHGALVLTAGSHSEDRERSTLLALSSRRVDGMLIVPVGRDQSYLRAEQAMGMPLVFVDRPPSGVAADAVLADDRGGGLLATQHLLRHGHRRVGVVGASASVHTVSERIAGYESALAEVGLTPDPRLVQLDVEGSAAAREAVHRLLAEPSPPTALFLLNSGCTIGALRALDDAGLAGHVAVVGFDDFDTADLLTPAVTVVSHDIVEMGRRAAARLFARIGGEDGAPALDVLPTTLIPRGSSELVGPRLTARASDFP